MQPKFVRRTDPSQAVIKQSSDYDWLIRAGFRAIEFQDMRDEKVKELKKQYYEVTDSNIEKNERFLERLRKLKLEIQDKWKKRLIQQFIQVVSYFRHAEIISEVDFNELIIFKQKEIVPLPHIDSEDQNIPLPKLIILDNRKFHDKPKINDEIIQYMKENIETEDSLSKKRRAIQIAYQMYKQVDWSKAPKECEVQFSLYGSCVNQLSTRSSDVDISLNTNVDCSEKEMLSFFRKQIDPIVKKHRTKEDSRLGIRVPVIEITLVELDVTISFSMNNKLGCINSRMIELYSKLDPRCQELALLVKMWATANTIISAKKYFLSSYAYNLMVINFLQTIEPPILPSLQAIRESDPDAEPKYEKVRIGAATQEDLQTRVDYEDNEDKLREIMERDFSRNDMNVVELLKRFFRFYRDAVKFSGIALSVKAGKHIPRNEGEPEKKYLYSIEDPFDLGHNPGKYVLIEKDNAYAIIDAMKESYHLIKKGKVLQALKKV